MIPDPHPWFWQWSPQFHFPWSGSVAQRIEPQAVFDAMLPGAGDAQVEQRVLAQTSYGKQLGLITRVLLDLAGQGAGKAGLSPSAQSAFQQLVDLQAQVAGYRQEACHGRYAAAQAALQALADTDQEGLRQLLDQFGTK